MLDRLIAEALEEGERSEAERHLSGCAACASRLEALRAEQSRFVAALPPLDLASARPAAPVLPLAPKRSLRPLLGGLSIAAAALLAFVGLRLVGAPEDALRTKGGGLELGFFVKHGEHVRRGGAGEVVEPGDALRFTYSSPRATYLTVLSRDPEQRISVYYPAPAAPAPAGRELALPLSTKLDESVGPETAFGLFCDAPIDEEAAKAALGGTTPAGCTLLSLPFEKRQASR
jgi:hypothetical protein